jgi:hypothetical protein
MGQKLIMAPLHWLIFLDYRRYPLLPNWVLVSLKEDIKELWIVNIFGLRLNFLSILDYKNASL